MPIAKSQESPSDDYPATRSSLICRVRNPSDHEGWNEFHATYQRLVFSLCLKSGLGQQDAEDVSQEAMAAAAKALPEFQLDRSKGSFRSWLYRITSNKVNDFLRKKYRESAVQTEVPSFLKQSVADESDVIGTAWDAEWDGYLLSRAMERVKEKVSARSLQIFHLSAVKQWSIDQVRANLSLGRTQVYLARYRVGGLVKKEIAKLRRELE